MASTCQCAHEGTNVQILFTHAYVIRCEDVPFSNVERDGSIVDSQYRVMAVRESGSDVVTRLLKSKLILEIIEYQKQQQPF